MLMDALELLRNVSEAYRTLATLQIDGVHITESGDENANSRFEQRLRFFYAAPDRMRYEPCGQKAGIQIADGAHLHTTHRGHGFEPGPTFTSTPVSNIPWHGLPHFFRPDLPLSDPTFIFRNVDQRVAGARIVRQEDGCHVLSVTYEPTPGSALVIDPDISFWVSASTLMVMKQQGKWGHRLPLEDEVRWSRLTTCVHSMRLNEPIPDGTFNFAPPPGAKPMTRPRSGSGFIHPGRNERERLEHHGSHEWDGDTLIEHSEWKIRGVILNFERRLAFSDGDSELRVDERITVPQGETQGSFKVPLK